MYRHQHVAGAGCQHLQDLQLNLKMLCSESSLPYAGWIIFFHVGIIGTLKEKKPSKKVWIFSLIADGGHSNITATLPILLSHVMAQAVSC